MTLFLRGLRFSLAAADAVPAPRPHEVPWLTLDAEPASPLREIHALVVDAQGARCGVASLAPIDWELHQARVAIVAAPGAAVAEALTLLMRYAVDELNLDALWAEPSNPEAVQVLASAGWRPTDKRRWEWHR